MFTGTTKNDDKHLMNMDHGLTGAGAWPRQWTKHGAWQCDEHGKNTNFRMRRTAQIIAFPRMMTWKENNNWQLFQEQQQSWKILYHVISKI